jgi:hypothetical protein
MLLKMETGTERKKSFMDLQQMHLTSRSFGILRLQRGVEESLMNNNSETAAADEIHSFNLMKFKAREAAEQPKTAVTRR